MIRIKRATLHRSGTWSLILTCVLAAACRLSPPSTLPGTGSASDRPFEAVRAHIEQLVDDGEVPSMAVAVARGGEIVWQEGFGLADQERGIPASEYTMYPLASVSKPLAATGLMVLVERGEIALDQAINDYLGEAQLQARVGDAAEATVHRVASHTAGLPLHAQHFYDGEPLKPPPMSETIRRYGNLIAAPGQRYQYSNLGYGLLGYVTSRTSGMTYADFMREEVFAPLGMDHTAVYVGPGLEEGYAVKIASNGRVVPPYNSDSPGASSIYSSAHDLIRFALFHLKNIQSDQIAIITPSGIDTMQEPNPDTRPTQAWQHKGSGYGIGWFIGVTADGTRVVYHSGGTLGVSSMLALIPEKDLAVAVLANTDGQWSEAIAIEILCRLLSRQADELLAPSGDRDDRDFALPAEATGQWQGFVTTFEGDLPINLEIAESGDIYAMLGEQPRTALQSVSYQTRHPQFMNASSEPLLRGWLPGKIETADVRRGSPCKVWLELKIREDVLDGTLVTFSQREFYTGPLSHWVALARQPGE